MAGTEITVTGHLLCAMHGDKLDGASPLWGFVIANH